MSKYKRSDVVIFTNFEASSNNTEERNEAFYDYLYNIALTKPDGYREKVKVNNGIVTIRKTIKPKSETPIHLHVNAVER